METKMSNTRTLRDLIKQRRDEIGDAKDLTPLRASEILVELTNILGNIIDQIRKTEIIYKQKLLECYKLEMAANRSRILAETSQEYIDFREARDIKEYIIEICRSLKYLLKCYQEDKNNYGNQ